jgi:Uma2 family endonuclease
MATLVTAPAVSVDEYLHSVYEPDMDLVDGVLEDRNVGEFDHAILQRALLFALAKDEVRLGYFVVQELRVQVSPNRYRVPDTCVLAADRLPQRIVTEAPLLCIEVVSPEDRFAKLKAKCQDYLNMGVPEVWILDPASCAAFVLRGNTITEHREGVLNPIGLDIELDLAGIFGLLKKK